MWRAKESEVDCVEDGMEYSQTKSAVIILLTISIDRDK